MVSVFYTLSPFLFLHPLLSSSLLPSPLSSLLPLPRHSLPRSVVVPLSSMEVARLGVPVSFLSPSRLMSTTPLSSTSWPSMPTPLKTRGTGGEFSSQEMVLNTSRVPVWHLTPQAILSICLEGDCWMGKHSVHELTTHTLYMNILFVYSVYLKFLSIFPLNRVWTVHCTCRWV